MNRLAQLRQQKAEARQKAKAIQDAIAARGADAVATAEELRGMTDLNAAMDSIEAEMVIAEKLQERLSKDPTAETRDAASSADPEDRGLRPAPTKQVEVKDEKPFRSLGHQMQAIARMAIPHTTSEQRAEDYNRLREVAKRSASGLASFNDVDGGFLIDTDFQKEIMENEVEVGMLAAACRQIPISANSNSFKALALDDASRADGFRLGGVTSSWLNEADTVNPSKPKLREIEIQLRKLVSIGYATEELLADASALAAVMSDAFKEEGEYQIDKAIFEGDGQKKPLGFMSSPALLTIAAEAGQATGTLNIQNLLKMMSAMPARFLPGATWYLNAEVWPSLIGMTIPTGTNSGQTVFLPPTGIHDNVYGLLFGRPVMALEHCNAIGTKGDIVFANLQQYALIKKGEVVAQESMHVRFIYGEMCYRIMQRVGGQPIPNSPFTPAKGNLKQSPFVTLAARP